MVAGAALNVVQLSYLSQSESAPFAALTLVWNSLTAQKLLGERFSRQETIGTVVVGVGTLLTVLSKAGAANEAPPLQLHDVLSLLFRPEALASGLILCICFVFVLLAIHWRHVPIVAVTQQADRTAVVNACLRTVAAGMFQGCTGLSLKCILHVAAARQPGDLERPAVWVFAAALVACLTAQIGYLNSALRRCDVKVVVPVFQAMLLITGVVFGRVFLRDSLGDGRAVILGQVAGLSVCLVGIAMVVGNPLRDASTATHFTEGGLRSMPVSDAAGS